MVSKRGVNMIRKSGAVALLAGATLFSAAAQAAPIAPQVDFRDALFAAANKQSSFSTSVDGIGFTVSAFQDAAGGGLEAAELWWDEIDGLGVWGNEDDEIGEGQYIVIDFDVTIGLSHLFFADLFDNETWNGVTYSESARFFTDFGLDLTLTAADLAGSWGNAGNGEAVAAFDKIEPVNRLTITVPKGLIGRQNFAVLGFTDPPLTAIPAPAAALFLLPGMIALVGLDRRRRRRI